MDSDLFGTCPLSAGPKCKRGPKWTPNGLFCLVSSSDGRPSHIQNVTADPLFYLHHAVCHVINVI